MIEIQTRDAIGLPVLAEADDAELVQGVLAGQSELFAVLMRRHNARVFRIARGITRDDADAQDAVQGAFVAAYRGLAGFRAEARFSTWLSRSVPPRRRHKPSPARFSGPSATRPAPSSLERPSRFTRARPASIGRLPRTTTAITRPRSWQPASTRFDFRRQASSRR